MCHFPLVETIFKGGLISDFFSFSFKSANKRCQMTISNIFSLDFAQDWQLFWGDLSQSEKHSEIKPPLAAPQTICVSKIKGH